MPLSPHKGFCTVLVKDGAFFYLCQATTNFFEDEPIESFVDFVSVGSGVSFVGMRRQLQFVPPCAGA